MFCSQCGASLSEGTKFCTCCGTPVTPPVPAAPRDPYLEEGAAEGTEYLGVEEATEWLSPDAPWAQPRGRGASVPGAAAPVAPGPAEARRGPSPALIAAVVLVGLLGVAAVMAAILLGLGGGAPGEAGPEDEGPGTAAGAVNWDYYEGSWALDGGEEGTFTLRLEGDTLLLSLRQSDPARTIEAECTPEEGDSQRGDYADDGQGNAGSILLTAQGEKLLVSARSESVGGLRYSGTASRAPAPAETPVVVNRGGYLLYADGRTVSLAPADIPAVGGDFQFWPSDAVRITEDDLEKLTRSEIQAVRNEIFARYGFPFGENRWKTLFEGMSWYRRDEDYANPTLPALEQDNVDAILAYEKAQGWRS